MHSSTFGAVIQTRLANADLIIRGGTLRGREEGRSVLVGFILPFVWRRDALLAASLIRCSSFPPSLPPIPTPRDHQLRVFN